jgi:5,10-methylenetetrahydrofolate reductase
MSQLEKRLTAGEFVVTGELTPPKGTDLAPVLEKAALLSGCVHAFNVTDSHASKMSLSAVAAAHQLAAAGVEPILQLTTRDRNRIALQGDMLGAWVLGVRNVVCMGGDPPHLGDHPEAKPVFDLPTEDLIRAACSLNSGTDLMGNPLQGATGFFIGAVVNPGADDLDREISRLEEKVDAGARFFQTQAVFDVEQFATFSERVAYLDIHLIAGLMPLKSVKMAQYMNEKIPGIDVPAAVMERLGAAADTVTESLAIAAETVRGLRPHSSGVHVMAPGWEEHVPGLLQTALAA